MWGRHSFCLSGTSSLSVASKDCRLGWCEKPYRAPTGSRNSRVVYGVTGARQILSGGNTAVPWLDLCSPTCYGVSPALHSDFPAHSSCLVRRQPSALMSKSHIRPQTFSLSESQLNRQRGKANPHPSPGGEGGLHRVHTEAEILPEERRCPYAMLPGFVALLWQLTTL